MADLQKLSLIGQALRDEHGLGDVAYVSLFAVMLVTVGTIPFLCGMALLDWARCQPIIVNNVLAKSCAFDSESLGKAVGLVCGGFSTALLALAGYMAATRPPKVQQSQGGTP